MKVANLNYKKQPHYFQDTLCINELFAKNYIFMARQFLYFPDLSL